MFGWRRDKAPTYMLFASMSKVYEWSRIGYHTLWQAHHDILAAVLAGKFQIKKGM
jgi:hypothetical protein